MKLSQYARAKGMSYHQAWQAFKKGDIGGYQDYRGTIIVEPKHPCTPFKEFRRTHLK